MNPEAASIIEVGTRHQVTVSCAESLTGGDVASALVSVPGASAVFRGGVVAYHAELKAGLLGVDAGELSAGGAVSAEVATAMAEGALRVLGSDYAVATTGVAGPDSEPVSGLEPGVVVIAVAGSGLGTWVRKLSFSGSREEIRGLATRAALQGLRDALLHDYPV
ncbi:nicotinamide-nucleotide amidohydrolase family protein [Pontimonas sp.]|nr:nicotinamide-nucleotide amidohydrolase family protein [Pontimonas sp.]